MSMNIDAQSYARMLDISIQDFDKHRDESTLKTLLLSVSAINNCYGRHAQYAQLVWKYSQTKGKGRLEFPFVKLTPLKYLSINTDIYRMALKTTLGLPQSCSDEEYNFAAEKYVRDVLISRAAGKPSSADSNSQNSKPQFLAIKTFVMNKACLGKAASLVRILQSISEVLKIRIFSN
ncbi:MAG: hypothetical protein K2X27_25460 [Candidatus Obscuribacterales bacterium]|nr:hypothetical protein [Candidatus Obscuribacterales bacterium]